MSSGAAPLALHELDVDYGGLRALDDVTLEVSHGSCVGLIGPNGAGKTTLFDAVTGVVAPTDGRVELFGHDVHGWPVHRRAQLGLGRTFQRLELFASLTVEENVIVALESLPGGGNVAAELLRQGSSAEVRRHAVPRAGELLDLVGLSEIAGARAGDLPMGLARMCELARMLAREPKLLLLDEPSSGLNHEETAALAALLRQLRADRTFVVVEHDMGFVLPLCDEVYVLDFGKVIARGTPDEIQNDPVVQAAYLGQEVAS